jgi:hypothetical protein
VIGEPHRGFGDKRGELFQLYPIELVDVDAREVPDVEPEWKLVAILGLEDVEL